MDNSNQVTSLKNNAPRLQVTRNRRLVWSISTFAFTISLLGLLMSFINPSIKLPLKPGLDFTGGTQIQLERNCNDKCNDINTNDIYQKLANFNLPKENGIEPPKLNNVRVQLLDGGNSIVLRLPFLTPSQSKKIVELSSQVVGPFKRDKQSINTIGPSLGVKLLRSSLISLIASFSAIALYISIRYDRRYAFLAILSLAHDIIIVCGIFAWLGIFMAVEVDSLFAVALLTIAGYSVNDTVVIFDRIRKRKKENPSESFNEQIDQAVSSTLTRTLYTSGTTLLPLIALLIFGESSLFWFSFALSSGVIIGSWSSIALAPSLLSLKWKRSK